jgi:hypothetical protein
MQQNHNQRRSGFDRFLDWLTTPVPQSRLLTLLTSSYVIMDLLGLVHH